MANSSSSRVRRARLATAGVFFVVGLVSGSWAARIPIVKHDLALSDPGLAVAFLSLEGGAVAGLQVGGALVPRLGSRAALGWSLPPFAAGMGALAVVPSLAALAVALAVFAAANSVVDVAMNTQGVAVEHRLGRPVMSGLHAMHPLGGITGAGAGSVASALGIARGPHFTATAALALAACALAVPLLLPSPAAVVDDHARGQRSGARPGWSRPVVLLGVLAFCLTFAEAGATHWSGVYLRDELHAGPGLAGAVVTVFLAAVAVGRLVGDRLVARFGPVRMVQASAAAGGLGLVAGLLLESVPAGMAGFALLGLGLSVTLPLALSAAGGLAGQPAAQAVARVSTLGYLGSFVAPVVIGALAGRVGLAGALLLPAGLVLLVAAAAPRMLASRDAS